MPLSMLKSMPAPMAKMWETVYQAAKPKYGPQKAAMIAWAACKKKYKKEGMTWVAKSAIMKLTLKKSGIFFPDYTFEIALSNDLWDNDGERVRPELMKRLVEENKIESVGDVEHERWAMRLDAMKARDLLNKDRGTEGLYVMENKKFDGNKITALIKMNKHHPLFAKYLALHKEGKYLYASPEFEYPVFENGEIVDAKRMCWTITDNPINPGNCMIAG